MISNSRLDFGGYPDHNANTGIFKRNFCHCITGHLRNFADN